MKNATEPERSAPCPRGSGLTHTYARLLLEHGHREPVRATAAQGEWSRSSLAERMIKNGRVQEALALLRAPLPDA